MGSRALTTQGFGAFLDVAVIVKPSIKARRISDGSTGDARVVRRIRVSKFDRDAVIRQLVREDEELIGIIISRTERGMFDG
jgi:hypothetical protein